MALKLKGSSSGYVALDAPATAGDNTLTLPVNNGSANQLLKTDGSGNLSWATVSETTINNNADNRVITGSGTANTLEGEANLTFNGSQLDLNTGSGTFNRWKTDQLRFNSTGTAHIDHYTNGQQFKFRTSASSACDTTALEIFSNGNVEVSSGNLVIGTSGKGIDFSSTGDAGGMTSELLDDYEEGTHTTAVTMGTSGTVALNANFDDFQYTKIGRFVQCFGHIRVTSVSSPVGEVKFSLPFAISAGTVNRGGGAAMYYDNSDSPNYLRCVGYKFVEGTSFVSIPAAQSTMPTIAASDEIHFSLCYWTAS